MDTETFVETVREGNETTHRGAIRDVLTDLLHLADEHHLNFDEILADAREVYDDEVEEASWHIDF